MSAGFGELKVETGGRVFDLRFELENRSDDVWRKEDGFCIGWQFFDPSGAAFLAEGHWQDAGDSLRPGEERPTALRIELPEEDGQYHIYVSPRTAEGWHYRHHWPFVLIEASVERGAARLHNVEVTTIGRLRRRGLAGRVVRAAVEPARTVWRHRQLIGSLARRDLAARYRGSLGDVAWTILHPLLLMLTYLFVFGIVLRARFDADPSRAGFVLYFLAGMLPWLPFSDAVARSCGVMLEHRNFVKKLLFPIETLPVSQGLAALASEGFALTIFLALLAASRGAIPATALWLPLLIVPQFLLTLGVSWFLAALGVYLRDLGQIIGFALTAVFFTTPICYPESSLPSSVVPLLEASPIYILVRGYRAVLIEGRAPETWPLAGLWIASALVCVAGFAWFHRLKKSFPDVI